MRHGKVEGTYARRVDAPKQAAGVALHEAVEDAKICASCGKTRSEAGIAALFSWDGNTYCSPKCAKGA